MTEIHERSTNHVAQSVAHLQIRTCICSPEQDRLLLLMQNLKKLKDGGQSSCLKIHLQTTVSHRVKLLDSCRRAWEEGRERTRWTVTPASTPSAPTQGLNIICNNVVTASFPCSVVRVRVVNSEAASDNKFSWHNPEANTSHELREEALFFSENQTQGRSYISFRAAGANSPCFQQSFRGNWPKKHNKWRLIVSLCKQSCTFNSSCYPTLTHSVPSCVCVPMYSLLARGRLSTGS